MDTEQSWSRVQIDRIIEHDQAVKRRHHTYFPKEFSRLHNGMFVTKRPATSSV